MVRLSHGSRGRRKSCRKDEGGEGEGGALEERRDDAGDEEEEKETVRREKNVEKMRVQCGKTGHAHEENGLKMIA